jgi:hypothetical protein
MGLSSGGRELELGCGQLLRRRGNRRGNTHWGRMGRHSTLSSIYASYSNSLTAQECESVPFLALCSGRATEEKKKEWVDLHSAVEIDGW